MKRLPRVTFGRAVSLDKEFSHDICSRALFPETHLYRNSFCLEKGRKGILELFTRPQSVIRTMNFPGNTKRARWLSQALGRQQRVQRPAQTHTVLSTVPIHPLLSSCECQPLYVRGLQSPHQLCEAAIIHLTSQMRKWVLEVKGLHRSHS